MNYQKEKNETIKEYKLRLFRNKDLYDLNTQQIADLINLETGDNFSESAYRKWFKPYQEGYEDGLQTVLDDDFLLEEYENKRIEFEKEKVKFRDYRNSYNKTIREQARNEGNLDLILEAIKQKKPYPAPTKFIDTNEFNGTCRQKTCKFVRRATATSGNCQNTGR